MQHYDICVIGGGPSGYAAAMRALDFGKKTLLVEKQFLGGAAIYNGALSSKTLWELSRDVKRLRIKERGYMVKDYEVNYRGIIEEVDRAVEERQYQLSQQIMELERMLPERFRFMNGFGKLLSPNEVEIDTGFSKETIHADYIVLATGSKPRKLPNIAIDEEIIVTSDGIANFNRFPESLVVLGAGVIGCEFATIFSNFGSTDVRIIDKADHILPFEDKDISEIVTQNLLASGVTIHRNASLESMEVENRRVKYVLRYNNGTLETFYAEKALISIGRVPAVDGLGAREIGLEMTSSGNFVVDADGRTNIPNIFAVGDLTADICLVNVGEVEGRHVVETICHPDHNKHLTYENISTIMFLMPEVSGVGANEQQLAKQGIPYRVATYSYNFINRAIAMRSLKGFYKILVSDDNDMRLLGMRIVGEQSSSAIQAAALLISMGKGIDELAELIHPHPSIPEGAQECVRMLLGTSIIKPQIFTNELRCHRVVNGQCIEMHSYTA
jgi:dihydrolipoamide dehydrogenase